ncbi:hypothetical protein ACXAUS_003374 [Clostridium sporogenes]
MEKSFVFNSINGDRKYKAEDFASYFASFIGNGVFPNPATGLQVIDNNNMSVTVQAGKGWINGYYYQNTGDFILKIDVADSLLNRIDRVVLRLDFNTRKVNLFIKKGIFASSPVAPSLQRDADMYELGIADIYVRAGVISIIQSNITDLRLNSNVCGIVHGVVEQVDTTAIFNQFQSWYSQTKEAYDKDIAMWTKEKKEAFDKWYIENTKAFINEFNTWYNTNTKQWEKDFTTWFKNTEVWEKQFTDWFATIKNALDGDIAAKLTVKTIELEEKINTLSGTGEEKEKLNKEDFSTFKTNEFNNFKKKTESDLAENAKQIETKVAKPTKAVENNIAIFDNTKEIKDSGKAIGNTSGKILELPSGLIQGDLLRVGTNGQIERLPIGEERQGLIIQDGTVKWGYTGCRIAQGRWKDTTTQVPFNSEYVKTIPLGFNAKRGRLYVVSKYGGASLNTEQVITHFICFSTELFNLKYTNFTIKTIGYDGNQNRTVYLDSIQIINDNLVIKSKSEQGYGSTYNTLKVDIGWEVEG